MVNLELNNNVCLFVGEFFDHNEQQCLKDQLAHAKKPSIKSLNKLITFMITQQQVVDQNLHQQRQQKQQRQGGPRRGRKEDGGNKPLAKRHYSGHGRGRGQGGRYNRGGG